MNPESYRDNPHFRHEWWRLTQGRYLPQVYAAMLEVDRRILDAWYEATERDSLIGEMGPPLASLLTGLISGNNITRVVQLGHYSGYSTLVLGFCLRQMGAKHALWSVDIDQQVTEYAQGWVNRAWLQEQVHLHVASSDDPVCPGLAQAYLGGAPSMVIIDSSHQYEHTLRELKLWWPVLASGGLMVLHDISNFARQFDSTKQGGVRRALDQFFQWPRTGLGQMLLLNQDRVTPGYMDLCGAGIIQKP